VGARWPRFITPFIIIIINTQQIPAYHERAQRLIQKLNGLTDLQKDRLLAATALLLNPLLNHDVVCHGDFHPDNIILSPNGPVVIDWTNASSGHPATDVGWTSLVLQLGEVSASMSFIKRWLIQLMRQQFHREYLNRYSQLRAGLAAELKQFLPIVAATRLADGIASEQEQLLEIIRRATAH
jgi:aminoglycoside phosphotransferase (APT) family kinase protein